MEGSPVKEKEGLIADGSIRSGKTLSMSFSFILWAMSSFNGQSFAMCGKTIGSFRRNVLISLKLILRTRGYRYKDFRASNYLEIRKGEVINYFYFFGGRDERSQDLIQGITLAGVLFDEVALMPESFVNQATGRCSVEGSKYWFNCNPEGPFHWFKENWIDKRQDYIENGERKKGKNLLYLHFTMEDNLSLSEEIKERYRSMYTGIFYLRYILGQWAFADGLIYDMFSDEENIYDDSTRPAGLKGNARRYIAIDYGTANPMVFLDIWDDGEIIWIDNEYYYDGRTAKGQKSDNKYGDDFEEFVAQEQVRPYETIIDPSAASFKIELRNRRYRVKEADNEVLDGIRMTATLIDKRRLKVHKRCRNWLKEVRAYIWNARAQEIGKEQPVKVADHAMDATRYFVKTVIRNRRLSD